MVATLSHGRAAVPLSLQHPDAAARRRRSGSDHRLRKPGHGRLHHLRDLPSIRVSVGFVGRKGVLDSAGRAGVVSAAADFESGRL